jgi:hypothetical protein
MSYPYKPRGLGAPIADFLSGKAKVFARVETPPPAVFHEGSGKVLYTVAPNDWSGRFPQICDR